MATEQAHLGDRREKATDAKDLLELLSRLEAKLEAAIADTRARRGSLDTPRHPLKRRP